MDKEEFIIIAYEPSRVRTFDNYELPGGRVVCVENHRFLVEFPDGHRTHRRIPFRADCETGISELKDFASKIESYNFLEINGVKIY